MDFGFYLTCYYPDPSSKSFTQLCAETIEQAVLAEDLGFTTISVPEHHFVNYLTIPSPLLMATAVAQHTRQVPIVSAVVVLPFYDPLRLAGEIALTDHLTERRLQLGLGRGAFRYEFDRFGVSTDESRPRFTELVTLLDLLLTTEDVTFDGAYYQVPRPVTIMPRPAQSPRPPFWIAALSEGPIKWAVSQGHNLQTTPLRSPFEVTRNQARWFLEARDELPIEKRTGRHHMLRNVYVSKSRRDLEAKERLLLENHRRFVNLAETEGIVTAGLVEPIEAELTAREASTNVIFGDPDEVIRRLKMHEELGIDGIEVNMAFGASQEDIVSCMRLFSEEVMPELARDKVAST